MRALFLAIVASFLFLTPRLLWAEAEQEDSRYPLGFKFGAHAGVNIASGFVGGGLSTQNRLGPQFGLDTKYYFSPNVGLFTGAQVIQRGIDTVGTAWFVDVPVGISFRYGGSLISRGNGFSFFDLGAAFSIPFGDIAPSVPTKAAVALYFGGGTAFPVTEGFSLGFASWGKYGLSSTLNGSAGTKILEIGLGLISFFG